MEDAKKKTRKKAAAADAAHEPVGAAGDASVIAHRLQAVAVHLDALYSAACLSPDHSKMAEYRGAIAMLPYCGYHAHLHGMHHAVFFRSSTTEIKD